MIPILEEACTDRIGQQSLEHDQLKELSANLIDALIGEKLIPQRELAQQRSDAMMELIIPSSQDRIWVIRDEHLQIAQVATSAVLASGAVLLGTTNVSLSTITGVITGIVNFVTKASKKWAILEDLHKTILVILKTSSRPLTVQEITKIINQRWLYEDGHWEAERIEEILHDLSKFRVQDGSIEAFALPDGQGRWATNGI